MQSNLLCTLVVLMSIPGSTYGHMPHNHIRPNSCCLGIRCVYLVYLISGLWMKKQLETMTRFWRRFIDHNVFGVFPKHCIGSVPSVITSHNNAGRNVQSVKIHESMSTLVYLAKVDGPSIIIIIIIVRIYPPQLAYFSYDRKQIMSKR